MGTAEKPGLVPTTLAYLFKNLPDIADSITFKPDGPDKIVFLSPEDQREQKRIHDRLLQVSSSMIDENHLQTFKEMQETLRAEPSATVQNQDDLLLGVWVSFAEIYNEDVFDLPKSSKKQREKLEIKMSGDLPYVKNLTTVFTSDSLEAYRIFRYGLSNLRYASTGVNIYSSRAHSVFTIRLIRGSLEDYAIGYFNFCDLAGFEKLDKTLNIGERLAESNSNNTSLLVLERCISSILSSQKAKDNRPVSYRDSKLTYLLQKALQGLEDVAMIVTVNLETQAFEETLHALKFLSVAKKVKVYEGEKIVKRIESAGYREKKLQVQSRRSNKKCAQPCQCGDK